MPLGDLTRQATTQPPAAKDISVQEELRQEPSRQNTTKGPLFRPQEGMQASLTPRCQSKEAGGQLDPLREQTQPLRKV